MQAFYKPLNTIVYGLSVATHPGLPIPPYKSHRIWTRRSRLGGADPWTLPPITATDDMVAVWLSGNGVAHINQVTLRRT